MTQNYEAEEPISVTQRDGLMLIPRRYGWRYSHFCDEASNTQAELERLGFKIVKTEGDFYLCQPPTGTRAQPDNPRTGLITLFIGSREIGSIALDRVPPFLNIFGE